jgi:ATP-dependent Clp protease ATP-binding subunit ClpA
MFERFTDKARHVVVLAQEEARRLDHNYIGTEHLMLGLFGEPEGVGCRALVGVGMTLDEARNEVLSIIGRGKSTPSGHIPFTPRAKKVLELALREALQLQHNYIGTEHILLGMVREGEGVAAKIIGSHADLLVIRTAVLDLIDTSGFEPGRGRRWSRRRSAVALSMGQPSEQALSATPAADTTLSEATRLAGTAPVGSHHLMLAILADPQTAAARALTALGVGLGQAKEALLSVDVTGTSDEQPEEAGRRQMTLRLSDDKLTIEAVDPIILAAARTMLEAFGDQADSPDTIRGDNPVAVSLTNVWQALHDSLAAIQRRATLPAGDPDKPVATEGSGTEAA